VGNGRLGCGFRPGSIYWYIMDDLRQAAVAVRTLIQQASARIGVDGLTTKKAQLDAAVAAPDFWNDAAHAQEVVKEQAKLERRTQPWVALRRDATDLAELAAMGDPAMRTELERSLADITARFDALKEDLKFSGPYDDHDAILSIHAGAGGSDAQDWAGMLLRMYVRYAEKQGWQVATVDESGGEEGGIKSVTLSIGGDYAYGKLKGEHGVHRLAQLQLEQHAERVSELKGPSEQAAWGNQIRSYVLHPYKQVKDLRTEYVSSDPDAVLAGELEPFIAAYLERTLGE
jgi:hypothetical protein